MNKKYGIFYNQQFDMLMVAIEPNNKNAIKCETQGDLIILKADNQIIGVNIIHPNLPKKPKYAFCSEDPEIVAYVQKKLQFVLDLKQEPQFLIAKVVDCTPIPKTQLFSCKVDINKNQLVEVVCGAPNVRVGLYTVLATEGTWMPNSQVVQAKTLHGYQTNGMLCSARELHLSSEQKGILELPKSYFDKVGQSFWKEFYSQNANF